MAKVLLEINNLKTYFHTDEGIVKAVDGIDFTLDQGDTLGIVGESGCGKSVTALSIMQLIPQPPGKIVQGEVNFDQKNLLELRERDMEKVRGKEISMIFQDPMTSLNPSLRVGDQICEIIKLHQRLSRKEAWNKSIEMLENVRIPSPEKRVNDYPFQMSGGMRQRVMIAIALSCNPKLLIADEPTTALDVTVQAQILDLMQELKDEIGTSILLITHNLGVIAEKANNVIVMYAGRIMECADVQSLFGNPLHPYTIGLMNSIPQPYKKKAGQGMLHVIPGVVPNLINLPEGCKFNNRCERVLKKCHKKEPHLVEVTPGHTCRCWLFDEKA